MAPSTLIRLKNKSWLVPGPTNIGLVETDAGLYSIDSGNDKDAGRKLLKLIRDQGWTLKGILNTHSNADHIGANNYLQAAGDCEIWASPAEAGFITTPVLESSFLWGGFPYRELRSKFFEAKPSRVTRIMGEDQPPPGLQFIPLPGHFFGMTGILTDDGIFYLGDSLVGSSILEKYKIPFIYDLDAYRQSIAFIRSQEAEIYVPSHGEPVKEIALLAEANLKKTDFIEEALLSMISRPLSFEDILQELCRRFRIQMDAGQYVLVGSTIRSFLTSMSGRGLLNYTFGDNRMLWEKQ